MPVVIEAIYVAVPMSRLVARLPEAALTFWELVPNMTYTCDSEVVACGFMAQSDAAGFVAELVRLGLTDGQDGPDGDVVTADMITGLHAPSNWAVFEKIPAPGHPGFTHSTLRLKGGEVTALAFMEFWTPEDSINFHYQRGEAPRPEDLELIGREGEQDVYRHKVTGKIFYAGRTSPPPGSPRVRIISPRPPKGSDA